MKFYESLCVPSKKERSKHFLLEENNILKELVDRLHRQNIDADDHCEQLKTTVDTVAKQNLSLSRNIESLEKQTGHLNSTIEKLESTNKTLVSVNETLERQKADLEQSTQELRETILQVQNESQTLISEKDKLVEQLRQKLGAFDEMVGNFGNKVSDIEESLFKCYYEYRAENRLLHYNNLLHIFLSFDQDGDGQLNENEFMKFNQYLESVYGQKIEQPPKPLTPRDLVGLELKVRAL